MVRQKRKQTEAQLKNLEKGSFRVNGVEFARKAQEQSVIARMENKAKELENETTAEILIRCLNKETTDEKGNKITVKEKMILSLLEKAIRGDIRAVELIIKLIEEMPTDKKEILGTLDIQKVFISPDDHKQALEHIKTVIAESFKNGG